MIPAREGSKGSPVSFSRRLAPANERLRADLPVISMVAASSEKNFVMEELRNLGPCAHDEDSWPCVAHRRVGLLVLDCLRRSTGLSILGLLPPNYLSRLQFEFSRGARVPNFVPDGLNRACRWPQVEDGGLRLERIPPEPQEVCSGGHQLHEAGRGHRSGPWRSRPSPSDRAAGIDNDSVAG